MEGFDMVYSELSDMQIGSGDGVNTRSLNRAFGMLLLNDASVMPETGIAPCVWEASWYNDKSVPGYSKGDAVWLNTQDVTEFVRNRAGDIETYAAQNQTASVAIARAKDAGDEAAYLSALGTFAFGLFQGQTGPVYYIGQLTSPVRVRISKTNGNKNLPTDDSSWEDFFKDGKAEAEDIIRTTFAESCVKQYERHMSQYHLSGAVSRTSEISSKYLLKDFSNVAESQQFFSHYWYGDKPLEGFDCVKKFIVRKFDGGTCKWFRIWRSGLVEHGGIVDPDNPAKTGDSLSCRTYTVKLNWEYDGGVAPVYDYPPEGIEPFYGSDRWYEDGCGQVELRSATLGTSMRYSVSLATIDKQERNPYGSYCSRIYDSADVCFMNNGDFSFLLNGSPGVLVSYCVKGYSVKVKREI